MPYGPNENERIRTDFSTPTRLYTHRGRPKRKILVNAIVLARDTATTACWEPDQRAGPHLPSELSKALFGHFGSRSILQRGIYESTLFPLAGPLFVSSVFREGQLFSAGRGASGLEAERCQPHSLCARTHWNNLPPGRPDVRTASQRLCSQV